MTKSFTHSREIKLPSNWATFLIFLLFPLFYLYDSGLALGFFGAFGGSWFGLISVVFGLPFVVYLFIHWVNSRQNKLLTLDVFVCLMVLYFAIWILAFYQFGTQWYNHSDEQLWLNFVVMLEWIVLYFAFKHCRYENRTVIRFLFICWVLMFLIAILNMNNGFFYASRLPTADANATIATYQGFARSAFVVSVLILVNLKGARFAFFALLSVVLLFVLGARTEFIGLLLALAVGMIIGSESRITKLFIFALIVVSSIIIVMYYWNVVEQSRIGNLLSLSQDASWQKRNVLSAFAWQTILDNPLLGDYGSEALVGGVGYYAHNVLSAWVTYGFFGFLQFVFLNLLCLFWTIRVAVRRRFKCRPLEVFALIMSSYSVMTMIFSQTVNSPIYAVGWGATVASLLVSKNLDGIGIARAGKKSLYRGGGKSLI